MYSFNPYLQLWFGKLFMKQDELFQESALRHGIDFNRIVLKYKFFVTTQKIILKLPVEQPIFPLINWGLEYIQTIADFAT